MPNIQEGYKRKIVKGKYACVSLSNIGKHTSFCMVGCKMTQVNANKLTVIEL